MFLPSFFSTQYFETDDPEFYKSKVCFILNNDVSEMDLVFAEEKYSKTGQLEKVRKAVPEGGTVQPLPPVPGEAENFVCPRKWTLCWALARGVCSGWDFRLGERCWSHSCQVIFCFQVVELVTGGAQVPVTNENKIFYLNLLAQYRLANQVREEVDHFLKGNTLSAPLSFLPSCPKG